MCACGWLIRNTCIIEIMICTPFHCLSRIFPRLPLSMEMTETPILAPCIMQVVVHLDLIWFVNDKLWNTKPCKFWMSRMPDNARAVFGPPWGSEGFPRPYGPIERKTWLELVNDNREMMSREGGNAARFPNVRNYNFEMKIYSSIDIYFW